jgi:hypothetical protein
VLSYEPIFVVKCDAAEYATAIAVAVFEGLCWGLWLTVVLMVVVVVLMVLMWILR